ncbi:unannotated protein [freshwater metagenome]|uniref:Unannotated protein n=1 Tax=freshwater metagenome TaxID=449393 RepID=A0A6J7A398_9ZZZZ|nr:DUF2252 domain-containing protein [Actinomycetota bacterium]MSX76202.1 DUF2252 domain-containing protein [Actinomycetota bacterium]
MTVRMTMAERTERGKAGRSRAPRSSHADWQPSADRPDPVALLEDQNSGRVPWLMPVRRARMQVSPFTFFRGAARIMAVDLASTPTSGLEVQLSGDAHLSNFGAYASPERQLVFDQNDFDETLPGPWEWDLKRLAASFMIAGQHMGFTPRQCRTTTSAAASAYRQAMAGFAEMGLLDLWYDHVTIDDLRGESGLNRKLLDNALDRFQRRATRKTSLQALSKLAEVVNGEYRIRTDAPLLLRMLDLPDQDAAPALEAAAIQAFADYKQTLEDHRRHFLERYELVDVGLKVVGVGSVGTRCVILLLKGRDDHDPLFLQAKEAGPSVLEEQLLRSEYDNHGRRVVEGQRLIQAQSDSFLGWTKSSGPAHADFYLRQLRDWKGSFEVEESTPTGLEFYARLCGMTLARGHARSGDAAAISAYCGTGASLDRAITTFSENYAAQNLEDFKAFRQAISDGRLEASEPI